MFPAELPDLFGRVLDTRRSLVVDEGHNLRTCLELRLKRLKINRGTPVGLDLMGLSIALAYLIETLAELAVDDTGNLLVPSYSCNCGFHAGSAGPADDKEVVCCTKCGLEYPHAVGIRGTELGAAVVYCLTRHCKPDPFRYRYRARQHQEKFFFHVDLLIVYLDKHNICLDG